MKKSTSRIVSAFEFAFNAHKDTKRKASNVPYITHPLSVAVNLMKSNASEDLIIAGLLHDVVEDEGVRLSEIEELFGKKVASLVKGASEPPELRKSTADPKKTWRKRKQYTIDFIRSAEKDLKLLSCADKLSNIKDTIEDYNRLGEKLWDKFNAPKSEQGWYYRSMCDSYQTGPESIGGLPIFNEFKICVNQIYKNE